MCNNQIESNGQLLYKAIQKDNSMKIDSSSKDLNAQSTILYALGMYHRLYRHKDINQCIHSTLKYLQSNSISIILQKNQQQPQQNLGELINGETGTTAFGILGLIEICAASDHFCTHYTQQLKSWINGLITMREYKLLSDKHRLTKGAFAEKIKSPSDYNKQYDAECYLTFCRLLKYKKQLVQYISCDDHIWTEIESIIEGLDEYYIAYDADNDDAHWIVQALYDRWLQLSGMNNEFMNHYMVNLMRDKLESVIDPKLQNIARCHLVEAMVDTLHAITVRVDHSKYTKKNDSLHELRDALSALIPMRYEYISKQQLFENEADSKFDGAFVGDHDGGRIRIDDNVHCLCALMKIDSLYYHSENE